MLVSTAPKKTLCMCICIYVHIYIYTYVCIYVSYIYIYLFTHISYMLCVCMYIYIMSYIYISSPKKLINFLGLNRDPHLTHSQLSLGQLLGYTVVYTYIYIYAPTNWIVDLVYAHMIPIYWETNDLTWPITYATTYPPLFFPLSMIRSPHFHQVIRQLS
jgi:hypothetical protein